MPAECVVHILGHRVHTEARRPFATYAIQVQEGDRKWTLERRWNDLRIAIDALKKTHNLDTEKLPLKFEPHGWRTSSAMLQPEFLQHRAENMQTLLNSIIAQFHDVSFEKHTGPPPLLDLLSSKANPAPGVDATPRGSPAAKAPSSIVRLGHPVNSPTSTSDDMTRTRRNLDATLAADADTRAPGHAERRPSHFDIADLGYTGNSSSVSVIIWTAIPLLPLAAIVVREFLSSRIAPAPAPPFTFF